MRRKTLVFENRAWKKAEHPRYVSEVLKVSENKEKVREIRRKLLELELVRKKGVLVFANYELTELGEEILKTYSKIYDGEQIIWRKELSPYSHLP